MPFHADEEDHVAERYLRLAAIVAAVALVVPGCSDGPTSPPYDPAIPAVWASAVTNQYFPLVPGGKGDRRR